MTLARIPSWRLLHTPPLSGPLNMAIDQWLMQHARHTGAGLIRVYGWNRPTISLGRNQTARRVFDDVRLAPDSLGIVRRLTGGRAIVHHREITYAVAAPVIRDRSMRADYEDVNALLLHALRALGVDASVAAARGRLAPPGSAPCFELPAEGELMAAGKKLVGSAQYREPDAFLQHGSILVHDDQSLLQTVTTRPMPITPAATLHDLLGREVEATEFAEALQSAAREVWDVNLASMSPDDVPGDVGTRFARYEDDAWTWRR